MFFKSDDGKEPHRRTKIFLEVDNQERWLEVIGFEAHFI
jgi:hypothetical protein